MNVEEKIIAVRCLVMDTNKKQVNNIQEETEWLNNNNEPMLRLFDISSLEMCN